VKAFLFSIFLIIFLPLFFLNLDKINKLFRPKGMKDWEIKQANQQVKEKIK
jgi:hypothetical protein